ncbi:MAG TPA: response regulator [Thermoanaerobaculia bacterium]|nr:response regulator [Thermoanaerobaculia bacterium]
MKQTRLLIVDDEVDLLDMLRVVLDSNGFDVVTASSGMQALVLAAENPPDVILLDVMMGEMDGWEVLRLLKLDENTQEIPVIILSARTETHDKIRGLQEGAADYITKPFSVKELIERVGRLVEGGGG